MGIPNPLLSLRPWLTVSEAADYLSGALGVKVQKAQIYRHGIDGLIPFAVDIPIEVTGRAINGSGERRVAGVFDLVLVGAGLLELQRLYICHSAYREHGEQPEINMAGRGGATVRCDGVEYELPADPGAKESGVFEPWRPTRSASALPEHAYFVLRMADLQRFVAGATSAGPAVDAAHVPAVAATESDSADSPPPSSVAPVVVDDASGSAAGKETGEVLVQRYLDELERQTGGPRKPDTYIWRDLANYRDDGKAMRKWMRGVDRRSKSAKRILKAMGMGHLYKGRHRD